MSNPNALVQKLWNYCSTLRDDGLSYGDCEEQLTLLIFLKVEDKRARASLGCQNQRRDAAATFSKLAVR